MPDYLKELQQKEDAAFKKTLMRDITYFHRRYAKSKEPLNLEIATNLGIALTKLK